MGNVVSKPPKPRNDPWDSKDFSASVPIESGVLYTKVTGPYTAKDRKLWPVLLHNAWQNDEVLSQEHHIPISRIVHLFTDHGCDNSARWIWESAKRLSKTQIEWVNVEHNRKKAVGFSVLLSSAVIEKDELTGLFTLSYTIQNLFAACSKTLSSTAVSRPSFCSHSRANMPLAFMRFLPPSSIAKSLSCA